ncbi:MAG: winged helix-turn-helix domain-containing protein [Candidatus Eremiobacteraeota bacterium]|nr:winged helix-turn-helix domain-containing protein [Candidatus Eremiobacteraeota bacterium]MCW5871625.1 winged helix-turn-helix domain-containing protein [Candidatus Eremiobacteraeota bacterium]
MLPRRPKFVAAGREQELAELLDTAVQGGVLLLEGARGSGKTSLALECAHRLPRARWLSCWPQLSLPHPDPLEQPLFLDHIECLQDAPDWLAWCSQHLRGSGLIAIADRRLRLPTGWRAQRLLLQGSARCAELPPESQILSLPLPPVRIPAECGLALLEEQFLICESEGWMSLHPDLCRPLTPELHRRSLRLLQELPETPIWVETVFQHLVGLEDWNRALEHFQRYAPGLQQGGEFTRVLRLSGRLLEHDPRLSAAHYAQAEAHAAQGRLEQARADLDSVLRWGEQELQLRALAARCHLHLDLGQPQGAEADAQAALELADRLGGRQPARIKACNGLARVHNLRGQPDQGETWSRRALQLAQQCLDPKGEAYAFFILGQSLADQENWQSSLEHCQKALQLAHQQGEIRLTLLARYWMVAAFLHLERLTWAEELLQDCRIEASHFADLKMLVLGELMMAQLQLCKEELEAAERHLAEAEALVQRCGFPLLAIRGLLLKQSLRQDSAWGERARRLAENVGLALPGQSTQLVWTLGQHRELTAAAVASLRAASHSYDLWVDLERAQVRERQLGELPLLSKKIPMKLLLQLMERPGQAHSAESLFATAWKHPYEGESSSAQVRKNVATLRNLLEPDRQKPRYILMREHAYGQAGGYFFSQQASYCVIHP